MANSPGPSSSKTTEVATKKTNTESSENGDKKKKRTRRKPRNKKKDMPNSPKFARNNMKLQSTDEIHPSCGAHFNFMIQPVVQPVCTFYKQRDESLGHINLESFIEERIPRVFATCDSKSTLNLLHKIQGLSILNGVRLPPDIKKSSVVKKGTKQTTAQNEKKKKKKVPLFFPKYLSEEEVEVGLKCGNLIRGTIRINAKNPKESYVGNEDISKSDYMIASVLDRNRALDGDEVILRLKAMNEEKKKLMEVVFITEKSHPRTAVGCLEPIEKNKEFALFTPRDKKIPKMKIPKISWPSGFQANPKLYRDILFISKISEWKEIDYAYGTIIENIGLNGDLKVESLAILREFCLDTTPFGDNIQQFLPKSSDIPIEEFAYREDIRTECIFTIDPMTARDLDDAVSCKELPNGNFEIGVHISDASFYLNENTKLDQLVRKKATTIYMVDNVYHMLPVELCLQCSLLPGLDKLAFSVFWEVTPGAAIIKKRISRTIINSCSQLAYEHAQMMIEEPERASAVGNLPTIHNGFTPGHLKKAINDLQLIAIQLREKRRQNGSLKIDQVKIAFSLDPLTGLPLDFRTEERKDAHKLIEEFMLLANMTVAEYIYDAFPDLAFLRSHEPPKPSMMCELQKNLETVGIHIDVSSSGGIQTSLNKYVDDGFLGQIRMVVLNHLLAKPMKRAKYFCAGAAKESTNFNHFALSIPIYTHFTSPIRRYADVMTHRLLAASLKYCDKPKWIPEEIANIAENCNRQKYHAKKAGEASCDLYLAHYIEMHQPFIKEAVVVDTKDRSIDVIVLGTGSIIRIYTNNFGDNVTWKSEEIKVQREDNAPNETNVKKLWKIFVQFPKTDGEEEVFMVLEMFSLVRVALFRKPKSNKLEAKLLRPV